MNKNVNMFHGFVDSRVRDKILKENETIADDIDIELTCKLFSKIEVYLRSKEECPIGRGNWVIDFFVNKDDLIPAVCLKLPAEMTKEHIVKYMKPLMDKVKEKMN
jgi:hypothetical protein